MKQNLPINSSANKISSKKIPNFMKPTTVSAAKQKDKEEKDERKLVFDQFKVAFLLVP